MKNEEFSKVQGMLRIRKEASTYLRIADVELQGMLELVVVIKPNSSSSCGFSGVEQDM
ncbi:hypothetical protein AAZX31_01G101900 [Glycine max]